jgi:hypothetical protein
MSRRRGSGLCGGLVCPYRIEFNLKLSWAGIVQLRQLSVDCDPFTRIGEWCVRAHVGNSNSSNCALKLTRSALLKSEATSFYRKQNLRSLRRVSREPMSDVVCTCVCTCKFA